MRTENTQEKLEQQRPDCEVAPASMGMVVLGSYPRRDLGGDGSVPRGLFGDLIPVSRTMVWLVFEGFK